MILGNNFLIDRTIYPAIFRVLLGLVLLLDLILLFPYVKEIYAIENYVYTLDAYFPFLEIIRSNIQVFYAVFILVAILFILGIGKNMTSFFIFLLYLIKFMLISSGYGVQIARFTLLLFIFVNSFQYLSLHKSQSNSLISRLATLSIMLHLCLIYFSNATHKIINPLWQNGDALGYFFLNSQTTDIFNIGESMMAFPYLLSFMSYGVLAFQLLFPIFIWFKKTKWIFIFIGVLMHLGMALVLQVYFFQIVVILHFGFFIKDDEWRKIFARLKIRNYNG